MKLKRLKEAKKGYLDDEGKFFDFQTSEVSNGQYIDATKTGVPYYDGFLNPTEAKELEQYYNLKGEVVMMSPSEYFSECSQHIFESHPSVESLKRQRGEYDRDIINHLKEVILKYKRRFPMPYLNYTGSKGQEGLHRMLCLAELTSWDTKFPVLVITYADQDRADRENRQKEISKLRIKINSAIQDALRYRYSDIEEFKEQLQFSLDREWEWMNLPSPSFTLTEEGDSYIVTIGEASEEFLKSSLKIEKLSDEEYELDLDDVDLDNNEDFLIRYFGNDWREAYPHLKDVFKIDEELTTKTVRRDNPNDFSPFGYKVDFYDGEYHIGEGSVCGIKDDNAFLYDFEVYPKYRGMGYSKEMLQYLIDQYDLKQLFVKPDNNVAINLYQKYGFEFNDAYDPDDIGNMRLMIRESLDQNNLYIISTEKLDNKTLTPRVPNNYFTRNGYEDNKTARVCFAPSINQCLMGLSQNLTGKQFYVYTPYGYAPECVYRPSVKEVPDSTITGETWITCPVKVKRIGEIKVLKDSGLDGHTFNYGDKKSELYDWDWEWVSDRLNEGLNIDGITTPDELMDWMNDNITYELVDDEYSNSNGVPTKTAEEVLETKTGHCAEQSYLEKEVLDELGYESFLVMVKENNSKKEYGAEGSAHVFLVYKDEKDNYCWFEHSMQHARGIHKYTNLDALLQDVANQWWRYDKNSDILEVRFIDKYITGVDNWGLAKECYKYPVKYTFDISDNIMESDVPLEESYHNSSSINQADIDAMNKAIVNEFGRDYPGEGCILIAPDGTFINVYPTLADHEDLCTWLTEQGFDGVENEAEWLVETFSYVRCRNNPESLCYIELPLHNITRHQLYSLEDWINEKVKYDHISIELPDGVWKRFSLDDYFAEDIIKKIKRYYASGTLYENRRIVNDNK